MSNAEQVALGNTLAGVNQYKIFAAVMGNMKTAVDATTTAINSQGSAEAENAKQADSLKMKIQELQRQFVNLVTGEGGLESLLEMLIDAGTAILKFANSDLGNTIIKMTIMATTMSLLGKGFVLLKSGILDVIKTTLAASVGNDMFLISTLGLIGANGGLIASLKVLTATFLSSPLVVPALVIGAISSIITFVKGLEKAFDDSVKELKDLNSEYNQTTDNVKKLEDELSILQNEIKKINNEKVNITDEKTLNDLKLQSRELERQLALAISLANQQKDELQKKSLDTLNTEKVSAVQPSSFSKVYVTEEEEMARLQERYKSLIQQKEALLLSNEATIESMEKNGDATGAYTRQLENNETRMSSLNEEMVSLESAGTDVVANLMEITDGLTSEDEATQDLKKSLLGLIDGFFEITGATDEAKNKMSGIKDEVEEVIDTTSEFDKALQTLENGLSNIGSVSLDGIKEAFDLVREAQDELNNSSGMSASTYEKLMGLGSEYLSLLFDEEGQLRSNANAEYMLYDAKIDEMAITQASNLIKYAERIALDNSGVGYANLAKNIDTSTNSLWNNVYALMAQSEVLTNADKNALTNQIGTMQKWATQAKSNIRTTKTASVAKAGSTNKTKKQTDAIKGQTDALKEQKKALDDLKSQYETVINYINDLLEDDITVLEKQRDVQLDSIDKQIKALEKLKDAELDSIDKSIEVLEKKLELTEEEEKAKLKALSTQLKALEEEEKAKLKALSTQKKNIEELKKSEQNALKQQIDGIQKAKKEREDYWNSQINAIKKSNDVLNNQISLQEKLQAIESAKSIKVKIFKDGEFTYGKDESAISEAEQNLEDFLREQSYNKQISDLENLRDQESKIFDEQMNNLNDLLNEKTNNYEKQLEELALFEEQQREFYENEKLLYKEKIENEKLFYENEKLLYELQIESLNNLKDEKERNYDEQIESLENQSEAIKEQYRIQIFYLEEYKKNFENLTDSYKKAQDKLLAEQLTGIDFENSNWNTRLSNLQTFVGGYHNLLSQIQSLESQITQSANNANNASSNAGSSSVPTPVPAPTPAPPRIHKYKVINEKTNRTHKNGFVTQKGAENWIEQERIKFKFGTSILKPFDFNFLKIQAYAKGTSSIKSNQMGVVGDDPNKELVIGSKLNGQFMNLEKGSGVVNANSTKTLSGILNTLGTSKRGLNENFTRTDNTSNISKITIGNINLPHVKNGEDFVDYLQNFDTEMLRLSF